MSRPGKDVVRRVAPSAGAKGSTEALFHELGGRAGEAREVQKNETGSFWERCLLSSPASPGERGVSERNCWFCLPRKSSPPPSFSRFTNLISELPLMELVCILLTKFLKLSDLRQTQFSFTSAPSPQELWIPLWSNQHSYCFCQLCRQWRFSYVGVQTSRPELPGLHPDY